MIQKRKVNISQKGLNDMKFLHIIGIGKTNKKIIVITLKILSGILKFVIFSHLFFHKTF